MVDVRNTEDPEFLRRIALTLEVQNRELFAMVCNLRMENARLRGEVFDEQAALELAQRFDAQTAAVASSQDGTGRSAARRAANAKQEEDGDQEAEARATGATLRARRTPTAPARLAVVS